MIKVHLQELEQRIASACQRANRNRSDVKLVAVSKKQSVANIQKAYDLGIRDFGENYMQELAEKIKQLPKDIRWHFVGSLQSKKIKYVSEQVQMVHSLDSTSQIKAWNRVLAKGQPLPKLLIQLNVSEEDTKSGIHISKLADFWQQCEGLPVVGLMSFPAYDADPEKVRPFFEKTRLAWAQINPQMAPVLSMGVSSDFETAIEEGATHIRVGSEVFGRRPA